MFELFCLQSILYLRFQWFCLLQAVMFPQCCFSDSVFASLSNLLVNPNCDLLFSVVSFVQLFLYCHLLEWFWKLSSTFFLVPSPSASIFWFTVQTLSVSFIPVILSNISCNVFSVLLLWYFFISLSNQLVYLNSLLLPWFMFFFNDTCWPSFESFRV